MTQPGQVRGSSPAAIVPGDALALARVLVRADSRNPSLVAGAPGELAATRALADVLRGWGFSVQVTEAAPGRPNVVARVGACEGRSLMLNGHLDVVGTDGMTHPPFDATVHEGRLYGRGAADMKSGVACMCAAAARAHAAGALRGEVIIAAVVDEEFESIGTSAVLEQGIRADAAVVTEPTGLAVMPCHRGFVWVEVRFTGRAAHGSRYELGVDAIRHAGLLLSEIDHLDGVVLRANVHPLLGRGSWHASTIEGGTEMSTYPDRCVLRLERRILPGETDETAAFEVREACARFAAGRSDVNADVRVVLHRPPSDVAVDAPIVMALADVIGEEEIPVRIEGASYWTDAALLNAAGIPAVCFGPGDIAQAHAAEEWVETRDVERATAVLARLIGEWCR